MPVAGRPCLTTTRSPATPLRPPQGILAISSGRAASVDSELGECLFDRPSRALAITPRRRVNSSGLRIRLLAEVHLPAASLNYGIVRIGSCGFQSVLFCERLDFRHRVSFSARMGVVDKLWTIYAMYPPNGTRKHRRFNVKSKGFLIAL